MALKLHLNLDAQLSPVERGIKIEMCRFVGAYFYLREIRRVSRQAEKKGERLRD